MDLAPVVTLPDNENQPVRIRPGVLDADAEWLFRRGQCLALAVAISKRTGWSLHLRTFSDDDGVPWLRHAYVQAPDGALVDVNGINDADIVDEECRDLDGDLADAPRVIASEDADLLLEDYQGQLVPQNVRVAATFIDAVLDRYEHG